MVPPRSVVGTLAERSEHAGCLTPSVLRSRPRSRPRAGRCRTTARAAPSASRQNASCQPGSVVGWSSSKVQPVSGSVAATCWTWGPWEMSSWAETTSGNSSCTAVETSSSRSTQIPNPETTCAALGCSPRPPTPRRRPTGRCTPRRPDRRRRARRPARPAAVAALLAIRISVHRSVGLLVHHLHVGPPQDQQGEVVDHVAGLRRRDPALGRRVGIHRVGAGDAALGQLASAAVVGVEPRRRWTRERVVVGGTDVGPSGRRRRRRSTRQRAWSSRGRGRVVRAGDERSPRTGAVRTGRNATPPSSHRDRVPDRA